MRKVILPILFLLMILIVPASSDALTVTITPQGGVTTTLTTVTTINGKPSIVIEGTYPPGGGTNTFTISTCTKLEGCSGFPARVFVDDGNTIDNIVLTDAKISTATGGFLTINFHTDTIFGEGSVVSDLTAIPGGTYPYAIAINGVFLGTGPRNDVISATGFGSEGFSSIGTVGAPSFSTALTAAFNRQATANLVCPPFSEEVVAITDVTTSQITSTCFPQLSTEMTLTFVANTLVRLPGSINVLGANVTVENGGLGILARALDDLQPGVGPKVYDVRLQPSPGTAPPDAAIVIRGKSNSMDAWVVDRGAHQESQTQAEIRADGIVKVRAKGLCPASGCPALGQEVHAALSCGDQFMDPSPLALDQKGDGEATLIAPVPCADPAVLVLIRDLSFNLFWVAAPGLF